MKFISKEEQKVALFIAKGSKPKNVKNRNIIRLVCLFPAKFTGLLLISQFLAAFGSIDLHPSLVIIMLTMSIIVMFTSLLLMNDKEFYVKEFKLCRVWLRGLTTSFFILSIIITIFHFDLIEFVHYELIKPYVKYTLILPSIGIILVGLYWIVLKLSSNISELLIRSICWVFRIGLVKTRSTPFKIFSLRS